MKLPRKQSMLQEFRDPLTVLGVRLASGNCFDVLGVCQNDLKMSFENVPHRFPINTRGFHGHVLNVKLLQPQNQLSKLAGGQIATSDRIGSDESVYRLSNRESKDEDPIGEPVICVFWNLVEENAPNRSSDKSVIPITARLSTSGDYSRELSLALEVFTMKRDITEKEQANQALHESEERLRQLILASNDWMWEVDANAVYTYAGPQCLRILGYEPTEIIGRTPFDLMSPDEAVRVASIFNPLARERKAFWGLRNVNLHKDGHSVVLETNGAPILDADGNFYGYRGFDRDVTERDRAEMDLRKSEERFRRVVEHIGDAVIADDLNGHIVFANDRFLKLFGFSREQLPTLGFENYIAPQYREQLIDRHYRRMRGEDVPTHFEYEGVRTDGTSIWLEVDVVRVTDTEGKIIGTQSAIRDITARRRTERAIQESEQRLRHLIESSNDWIYEMDRNGVYSHAGPQCRELLGYEPDEMIGKSTLDFMPADELLHARKDFQDRLVNPRPFHGLKSTRVHKDGRRVVWETNAVPFYDKDGEFHGYRGMARDVTERHRAEQELRQSEERFRRVVEHIGDALAVDDRDGRIVFANDQFLRLFGFARNELETLALEDFVAPEYRVELRTRHVRRMRGEALSDHYEFQGIRRDGMRLWIDAEIAAVKDHEGNVIGSQRVLRDISEQKRVQQVLRESEERLRHIISSSYEWVWEVDDKTAYTYCAPQCRDILGYEPEEIIGKTPFDLMPPDEATRLATEFRSIAAERRAFRNLRTVKRHKNGHLVVLEANGLPILGADGTLHGYRGMARDITERDRAEQALRESEERFRLVANTAPVMIWSSGTNKLCDYFNRPWLHFTGRPLEAELGNGWTDGIHPEDFTSCLHTYSEAFDQRRTFEMHYRLRRHDGEYRWLLDIGVPRINADGSFAGYIGSCIDITERKQAEKALASIGRRLIEAHEEERTRIGRELHDDISQRLALLAIELDRWNQKVSYRAELRDLIVNAQQRIHGIAKDVQSLSHRLHSSKLDYLGLATAASSFCRELSERSDVNITFSHKGIPLTLPKEVSLALFRVLQEALQNAVKHSGVRDFKAELRGASDAIELTVTDNGRGFQEQEAFTRPGIGLISMRERLQLLHGELSIKSRPNAGTTIHARIPLERSPSQSLAG